MIKPLSEPPETAKKRRKGITRGIIPKQKARVLCPCFLLYTPMLIIRRYQIETTADNLKQVHSQETPLCPVCGYLMSGYDKRRRCVIRADGQKEIYLLRRLHCPCCNRLHLEIPDCIEPQKHYAADIIADTTAGVINYCPADDSTIRRWKKSYPPALPVVSSDTQV